MREMQKAKTFGLLAALFFGAVAPAQAQSDFPNKPVMIVVPFAAGGPSDVIARILADELKKVWNQQVIVDNKAGGGTVIGNVAAARAKPDGYTMLLATGSLAILPGVRGDLPYDTVKDLRGLSVIVDIPMAIVAHPGFAPNTLQELIAEAKQREARPLTFATAGVASFSHMVAELLQKKTGITLKHIPYTGASQALPDTLSGRVDFQVGTWADQRPYVEQGKLKLIAVFHRSRLPEAPNAATVNEVIPGFGAPGGTFLGISLPAGVPTDIAAKISNALQVATTSKTYQDRVLALGSYPRYTTPEETEVFMSNEVKMWTDLAKSANIRMD